MEELIRVVLPYLKHPPLVLVGCVALCFLGLLQRVVDPAIVGHLTQADAVRVLRTLIEYGFAVVCLAVGVALLLGPRG